MCRSVSLKRSKVGDDGSADFVDSTIFSLQPAFWSAQAEMLVVAVIALLTLLTAAVYRAGRALFAVRRSRPSPPRDADAAAPGSTGAAGPKQPQSVVLVVLGDIGRSPRMCYHADSLARHGFETRIVAHRGTLAAQSSLRSCQLLPLAEALAPGLRTNGLRLKAAADSAESRPRPLRLPRNAAAVDLCTPETALLAFCATQDLDRRHRALPHPGVPPSGARFPPRPGRSLFPCRACHLRGVLSTHALRLVARRIRRRSRPSPSSRRLPSSAAAESSSTGTTRAIRSSHSGSAQTTRLSPSRAGESRSVRPGSKTVS